MSDYEIKQPKRPFNFSDFAEATEDEVEVSRILHENFMEFLDKLQETNSGILVSEGPE